MKVLVCGGRDFTDRKEVMTTEQEVIPWWGYPLLPFAFVALIALAGAMTVGLWWQAR